jgi:hypothetical protein
MVKVINWNGRDLPEEIRKMLPEGLRDLPPGRYVVEPVDQTPELTPEEEDGLIQALREDDAGGETYTLDDVREHINGMLQRPRR